MLQIQNIMGHSALIILFRDLLFCLILAASSKFELRKCLSVNKKSCPSSKEPKMWICLNK